MTATPALDFAAVVDNLHDGVYILDRDRRILYWNKAAERITGFAAAEVLGRSCADNILVHVDDRGTSLCNAGCPMLATMTDREPREAQVFLHHKLGHRVPTTVRAVPLVDRDGNVTGAVESFNDASFVEDLRARVALLEKLSLLDPLTQLPNRRYVESELDSHLAMLRRNGVPCGIVMMDIDHFKQFNDEFGHVVGDVALQTVARTLSAVIRPFDLVGRWGGEEFVGVFPNTEARTLTSVAGRLCRMVGHSQVQCGSEYRAITISIGATGARESDTMADVIRRADELMYASKRAGRNQVMTDAPASARPA